MHRVAPHGKQQDADKRAALHARHEAYALEHAHRVLQVAHDVGDLGCLNLLEVAVGRSTIFGHDNDSHRRFTLCLVSGRYLGVIQVHILNFRFGSPTQQVEALLRVRLKRHDGLIAFG